MRGMMLSTLGLYSEYYPTLFAANREEYAKKLYMILGKALTEDMKKADDYNNQVIEGGLEGLSVSH